MCVCQIPTIESNQLTVTIASPVVTLNVSDRELLLERNGFEGDELTVVVQV